jgi:hypothetical protein
MTMTIPVVIVDAAGRVFDIPSIPIDAKKITVPVRPMGAFVFERTDERDSRGRPIFRQAALGAADTLQKHPVATVVQ